MWWQLASLQGVLSPEQDPEVLRAPYAARWPLPKLSRSFFSSLYSAVSRGKAGRMERGRQIPLVQQLPRTQLGVGGCQTAIFILALPKVTMLCPPLPAMLPLNSALQHDVGFLDQVSGARTPTLGALLCRCVGACKTCCYL